MAHIEAKQSVVCFIKYGKIELRGCGHSTQQMRRNAIEWYSPRVKFSVREGLAAP